MQLTGEIEKVIYSDPVTSFVICKVNSGNKTVTVTGILPGAAKGMGLVAEAKQVKHPKFGHQYKAESARLIPPKTEKGIQEFMCGMLKGVGPTLAATLLKTFGDKVLDVIDQEPERLLNVPGIGPTKLQKIRDSWQEHKGVQEMMVFLQSYGVTANLALKIHKALGGGNAVMDLIRKNPYCLLRVDGIGFKTADAIARNMGLDEMALERLQACVIHYLNEQAAFGHTFAPFTQVIDECMPLLFGNHVPGGYRNAMMAAIKHLADEEKVVVDEQQRLAIASIYYSEQGLANRLSQLVARSRPWSPLSRRAEIDGIPLVDEQVAAVRKLAGAKCGILTGGPGTGKTTVVKALLRMLPDGIEYVLAAPTGRAAQRLKESTGVEAKTIHRLLAYQPSTGQFHYGTEEKLPADFVLVDEASMLDVFLAHALVKALKPSATLILVGDEHQLPSVKAGNVLKDLIDSNLVTVARLIKTHRQSEGSDITSNAALIKSGKLPKPGRTLDDDFFFIHKDGGTPTLEEIIHLVCGKDGKKGRLMKAFGVGIDDIQILSPMRKRDLGTCNLNRILQDKLVPEKEKKNFLVSPYSGIRFHVGDRVIQTVNNYKNGVFNGDVGKVTGIDQENGELTVTFEDGQKVVYDNGDLSELDLAYAISVHKSQGSEYKVVVMLTAPEHTYMLNRNLIYTGVTRAKEKVVIVGSKKTLGIGVKKLSNRRNTLLPDFLADAFGLRQQEETFEDDLFMAPAA